MPPKRRAYELAKEFSIPNKEFVALLKDGGFPVNTHMTAFDDIEEIRIRGWLEAQGYGQKSTATAVDDDLSAFRKKKTKDVEVGADDDSAANPMAAFRTKKKKKVEEPEALATPEITDAPSAEEATAEAEASSTEGAQPAESTQPEAGVVEAGGSAEAASIQDSAGSVSEPSTAETSTEESVSSAPQDASDSSAAPEDAAVPTAGDSASEAEGGSASQAAESSADAAAAADDSQGIASPAAGPGAEAAEGSTSEAEPQPAASEATASEATASGSKASSTEQGKSADAEQTQSAATEPTAEQPQSEAQADAPAGGDAEKVQAKTGSAPANTTPEKGPSSKDTGSKDSGSKGAVSKDPVSSGKAVSGNAASGQAADGKGAKAAKPGDDKAKGAEAAKDDAKAKDGIVRPSEKRRSGKVVGFIDLSKVQSARPPRRDSRRLGRSDDSAVSSVQPTYGGRRRGGGGGGGGGAPRPGLENRGDLTAAQLREREAGRFLRRQRPGGGNQSGGRRGGRGGRGHRMDSGSALLGSPFRGQSVQVEEPISIKKLAEALAVKQNQLLKKAFDLLGFGAVNINSILEEDTAVLLAEEFAVQLEVTQEVAAEEALLEELAEKRAAVEDGDLFTRGPSVAVLGHVDHGKTTLIDSIRRSQITGGESGGITQHIGAYQVTTESGNKLTVVDTPGHAAFTSMRARGAQAVDIVILVVAADDGVMPQTEEAINHAKAAGVPIVVALNKMDKPEANPEKVLNELAAKELIPEEWGGQTAIMQVSALKGDGIDDLLERVFLESEVLELRAHTEGPASGVVLEAEVQQGRGIIAHLLVQDGSLNRGDVILAGEGYGKVRSITNDRGKALKEAGPSMPIEVTGLDKLPGIGERFHVVPDLSSAKEVAEERERSLRMKSLADRRAVSKDNLFAAVAEANKTTINVIVKADVQGSVEVLKSQLAELTHDEVEVRVLHTGVGQVSESDIDLAITSEAYVVAFHVGVSGKARQNAERESITIKNYQVIYELLDDLRAMMEGSLAPEITEEITGHVEIRRIFRSSRLGNIAGSHVIDGTVSRDSKLRLLRDGSVVFNGQIGSLRRESDETKEVREGFDCGIVIKNFNDIQEGDIIEAFKLVEVKRTL